MEDTAGETQMQSKPNVQAKDHYLLHYRGPYMAPPYSDKMSRERGGVGSQEGKSDKEQKEKPCNERHSHIKLQTQTEYRTFRTEL